MKPWYTSKTIIVNAIAAALVALEAGTYSGKVLNVKWTTQSYTFVFDVATWMARNMVAEDKHVLNVGRAANG